MCLAVAKMKKKSYKNSHTKIALHVKNQKKDISNDVLALKMAVFFSVASVEKKM